jgi:hypothetical protein
MRERPGNYRTTGFSPICEPFLHPCFFFQNEALKEVPQARKTQPKPKLP